MGIRRTVAVALTCTFLLVLPAMAHAAEMFANLTGFSGTVKSVNVAISSIDNSGNLHTVTDKLLNGLNHGTAVSDNSGDFLFLTDTVIFTGAGNDAEFDLSGVLLHSGGNKFAGPAAFDLYIPPPAPDTVITHIEGAANVTVIGKSGKATIKVILQPGSVRVLRNHTTLSFENARVTFPAMQVTLH